MSDDVDRAQEREEEMRQDFLAERARASQTAAGESALICEDCGDPISDERRIASPGCKRCVECQGLFEMDKKRRGMR